MMEKNKPEWEEKCKGKWRVKGIYVIKNTGNVPIGYYEVYFETTCEYGSKHVHKKVGPLSGPRLRRTLGKPIAPGEEHSGFIGTSLAGELIDGEPSSLRIYDWAIGSRD